MRATFADRAKAREHARNWRSFREFATKQFYLEGLRQTDYAMYRLVHRILST